MVSLLGAGCHSTGTSSNGKLPTPQTSAPATASLPMQDAHTETRVLQLEQEYIAAKNSRPAMRPPEAEAARQKAQQEKETERKNGAD